MTKNRIGFPTRPSKRQILQAPPGQQEELAKQRAEHDQAVQEEQQKQTEQLKKNAEDIAKIASTPEGQRFFRILISELGWQEMGVRLGQDGKALTDIMLVRQAKRDIWLGIRQHIPIPDLIKIEFPTVQQVDEIPPVQ